MTNTFDSDHAGPDASPGFLLWKVANLHQNLQRRALSDLNLTPTQFSVLACYSYLSLSGQVTQADVCHQAALDKMMVSDATRALITKGLVTKAPSETDGRASVISLTRTGRSVCNKALKIIEPLDAALFASTGDAVALADHLRSILQHLTS